LKVEEVRDRISLEILFVLPILTTKCRNAGSDGYPRTYVNGTLDWKMFRKKDEGHIPTTALIPDAFRR